MWAAAVAWVEAPAAEEQASGTRTAEPESALQRPSDRQLVLVPLLAFL